MQEHALFLLAFPFDAANRIYLGYLAGSLAIAAVWITAALIRRQPREAAEYWRRMTSLKIWWHPSARLDYLLLITNPVIRGVTVGAMGVSLVPVALATSGFLEAGLGDVSLTWSAIQVTAAYTLVLFIADDFTRFLLHYLMHKVPRLWSIHRLHHSAEVMTPFTVYRIHPLESMLYSLRMVVTQGVILGLFFFGFGMNLSVWEIAGANLFTYLFNLTGANLRHSHVWISWGPWLERVFISPAQHQIHHSDNPAHFDRNMGAFLAVWDGLFGTLQIARGQVVTSFGLRRGAKSPHRGLLNAYLEPCRRALRINNKN
ncbi:sterol desaturase family protein [Marinobacter daqiaonensis]|nr:sterol desaturase family protein [Marinobacter daqiaonensis]